MQSLALKLKKRGWVDALSISRASMFFLYAVLWYSWCWFNPDWIVDCHCWIAVDCMYIG